MVEASLKRQIVTPVTWLKAPEWLTPQQAADLTGHSLDSIQTVIAEGGVALQEDGDLVLIEKDSLYEFQASLLEVLHWDK